MRLKTDRLMLTTLSRSDWEAVAAGHAVGAAPGYPTEGDAVVARLMVEGDWPNDDWGPLQVRRLEDGLAIGGVGCKGAPDHEGRVEIGYGFAESARGHGYAAEAVLGLIAWLGEQGVREVIAECDEGNTPSIAVLRRCGFGESSRDDGLVRWSLVISRA